MTAIVLPNDLQEERYSDPPRAHGTLRSGIGYAPPRIMPRDLDLDHAAEILNAGTKIAMLVGAGALGTADELVAVPDRLSAGCAKALLGKAALPDDLPWVTGSIGLLGTEPSNKMMMECDTFLMIGFRLPLRGVFAKGRQRPRRADRYRRQHAVDPLSHRSRPSRRRRGNVARVAAPAEAKDGSGVAQGDRGECPGLVVDAGGAREIACRPDQPATRDLGIVAPPSRPRRQ